MGSDAGLPGAVFAVFAALACVGSDVGLPVAFVGPTGVDFGGAVGVGPALGNDVASATGMASAAGVGSLASPGRWAEPASTARGRSELLVVVLVGAGLGC